MNEKWKDRLEIIIPTGFCLIALSVFCWSTYREEGRKEKADNRFEEQLEISRQIAKDIHKIATGN